MTPEQALRVLQQVLTQVTATKQVHAQIDLALETLARTIEVQPRAGATVSPSQASPSTLL